jgi:carbonic anhydrase
MRVGMLQRSEMILPESSPCPWDYEKCPRTRVDDCIGPDRWGEVCEGAYSVCGKGLLQSPIDIDMMTIVAKKYSPQARPLLNAYKASDVIFKNTGRGLELEGAMGTLQCGTKASEDGAKMYSAVAVHFHSPSEHTRRGESFPLEIQIVHQADNTKGAEDLVVLSFLFEHVNEDTPESPFLRSLMDNIPEFMEETSVKGLDLNLLDGFRSSYVRYQGSVTTPPCEESVQYMVMSQVQPATSKQLEAFRMAIGAIGNARPTQPIAGRQVEYVEVAQFYLDRWEPSENFTKSQQESPSPVVPDISYDDE